VREAFAAVGAPRERTLGEWAALVFDAARTVRPCGEQADP
jgi:hypothetical protein